MTIANQTARTGPYNGNGSTTVFAYDFRILDQSHVVVTLKSAANVETVQTLTTNYTVSGVGGSTGGNITMSVAPASGEQLTFSRNIPQTQEVDLANRGGVQPEVLESAYDKLTQLSQDKAELLNRVPRFPVSSTLTNVEFPLTLTANTALIVNAGGTGYTNGPTSSQIIGAEAEAAAAAASATSADGSATSAAASAATASTYAGNQSVDLFNGTGSQTAFTLSASPDNENNTSVYISGVYQQKNTYAVSGTTLTFSTAPPSATGNVEVMHMSARAIETPADGSVTYPKFAGGLVDIDLSSVSGSDDTIASAKAIKTYVDAQVDTVDTLAETLAIGNTSGGTDLAVSAGDDITFTDSSKAIFGAGGDLEIYHNGSNTYINETGTGKLLILATDLTMADTGNAHNYLNAVSGAGVTLYYDNNSKIATTATGVTITGVATATTFEPNGDTAAGDNAAIGYTSTEGLIATGQGSVSDFTLKNDADAIVFSVPTGSDDIQFPNNAKIRVGGDVAGGTNPARSELEIYSDGADAWITTGNSDNTGTDLNILANQFNIKNTAGVVNMYAQTAGTVGLNFNGSNKFKTTNTGIIVTGTIQVNSGGITVGNDEPGQVGYDVTFFGATGGSYMLWDESANNLVLAGGSTLNGVTAPTAQYTSAEETKLAGIETAADVTDSTNVLAGLVGQEAVATGFTGTLDGVLGGGTPASASVTTLTVNGDITTTTSGTSNFVAGVNAGNSIASGGNYNVVIGDEAGTAITTGDNNVAIGYNAGIAYAAQSQNTMVGSSAGVADTGANNTGIGFNSIAAAGTGANNTAVGGFSLYANSTGHSNVAIGASALVANTTASSITAVGYAALSANTEGAGNTAVGAGAMQLNTTAAGGTALGQSALSVNTTGTRNTALGYRSMLFNTVGGYNTAVGWGSLLANTTASSNVAVGYAALSLNTTGTQNVAVGTNVLDANTTASYNTAVGYDALGANTDGHSNVAVGTSALLSNTEGDYNIAVGRNALDANTTGGQNVGIGYAALGANTVGSSNIAVGTSALLSNTTGGFNVAIGSIALDANTEGNSNVAVGYAALSTNTTAGNNVAVGYETLKLNTTGSNNTALGYQALEANTDGHSNVAVGTNALIANTTGTQNVAVGRLALDANTTASYNTAVGYATLTANTTGASNVAMGRNALLSNTVGYSNIAVGVSSLGANTTGYSNVAVGASALGANVGGIRNTALGASALVLNTSGNTNVAVGYDVLKANTEGTNNVAMGYNSLAVNTTGDSNVAIGALALDANTTASNNTAVGYTALTANTTGTSNTAVGFQALDANTTASNNTAMGVNALGACVTGTENSAFGRSSLTLNTGNYNTAVGYDTIGEAGDGSYNTAVGRAACAANTSGAQNTAVGYGVLASNAAGVDNSGIGYQALGSVNGGNDNSAVGRYAGFSVTTGDNNTFLGHDAGLSGSPGGAITTADNQMCLGDANIANAHIQVDWTVASDKRDKTEVTPLVMGLDFINKLEPVTYRWDKRSKYSKDQDVTPDGTHKEAQLDVGFLAQDVEELEKEYGFNFEDKTNLTTNISDDEKMYGLKYSKFVPALVKAVQELTAKVKELEGKLV